ncbi:MAG TPA: protein translocase subunit SecF, partial [Longimicrobiales bacterium]|nr:protein translocase subunit SecF [Longimicrobiales bacterium]
MLRLFSNANYHFIESRRINYMITAAALLLSIGFAAYWQVTRGSWMNYNVDFTGGTMMQVKYAVPTSVANLRAVVEPAVHGAEIKEFGSENEFLIRVPQFSEEGGNTVERLRAALQSRNVPFETVRTEAVGPKVGSELQRKAATAVLLSLIATGLYLAFRFEWRFALAAAIATAHDTILTLGFVSIFQFEVSLTTVAAILTVLGFSLHDTIIIFDRVREDLRKGGRRADFITVLNTAINETLPRTTLTVITTLATLASLAIFGGATIRGFATIMFFGIL